MREQDTQTPAAIASASIPRALLALACKKAWEILTFLAGLRLTPD
jgi:hypothetical protein